MTTIELITFWVVLGITIILGIGTAYTIGIAIDILSGGEG